MWAREDMYWGPRYDAALEDDKEEEAGAAEAETGARGGLAGARMEVREEEDDATGGRAVGRLCADDAEGMLAATCSLLLLDSLACSARIWARIAASASPSPSPLLLAAAPAVEDDDAGYCADCGARAAPRACCHDSKPLGGISRLDDVRLIRRDEERNVMEKVAR